MNLSCLRNLSCVNHPELFAPESRYFWRVKDDSTHCVCRKVYPSKVHFEGILLRVRYCTFCILSNGSARRGSLCTARFTCLTSLELWFTSTGGIKLLHKKLPRLILTLLGQTGKQTIIPLVATSKSMICCCTVCSM